MKCFVLTRGLDQCLFGYPLDEWKIIEEKLKSLPLRKKMPVRLLVSFSPVQQNVKSINKDELIYPTPLFNYAKLEKECVVLGVSNRIEIWNKEIWEEYFNESADSFADIAENMIGFDL